MEISRFARLWSVTICLVVSSPRQILHTCTCTMIQQIRIMTMATADYIIQVRTHNYNNPGSRLANGDCCQFQYIYQHSNFWSRKCSVSGCKNRFYYCLRSLGSAEADCSGGNTSEIDSSDRPLNFSHPTVLGLPNPLPLPGLTKEWKVKVVTIALNNINMMLTCMQGAQFFLEVVHTSSAASQSELIGQAVFDIQYDYLPLGIEGDPNNFSFPQTQGTNIVLSFRVVCAKNYYGQDCSQFCNKNCTCDPGFTGDFCHETNGCLGVDCGRNGQCVDEVTNYTCVCDPGFTGDTCSEVLSYADETQAHKTPNLTAVLGGAIGSLVVLVLLLLVVVAAMALIIRAQRREGIPCKNFKWNMSNLHSA